MTAIKAIVVAFAITCSVASAFNNVINIISTSPSPNTQEYVTTLHATPVKSASKSPSAQSGKKKTTKKKVKPTSRSVAIAALTNAALSTPQTDQASVSFATRFLEQDSYFKLLEPRDRAFARLIVATCQRRLGQIDGVLACCIDKSPTGKNKHLIKSTLRVGAAQLLFLKKPTFAVVKETVECLRIHHKLSFSSKSLHVPEPQIKFVNGVLRKLSRIADDTDEIIYALKLLKENTTPRDNIAPWLIEQWEKDWGVETTNLICDEIMPHDERSITHYIDLTTKYSIPMLTGIGDEKDDMNSLVEKLGEDSIMLSQGSIRVGVNGDVRGWAEYDKGTWWVQDSAATIPGIVLTKALYDRHSCDISNLRVVDMCSAPGGKAAQLLSAGYQHVTAIEASAKRSNRLKTNLERLKFDADKYDIVVKEGQDWSPGVDKIDGILVDVPCSSTGTGSRRPDVLRRESDISELLDIQEVLAAHCAEILPKGGVMVYATCSLLKEESEDQVKKLIERGLVETLPIQADEIPGFEGAIDENGWVRVIPGVLDSEMKSADGFFAARLVKK